MNRCNEKRIIRLKNNKIGILDSDLADMVGMKTKALNRALKRSFSKTDAKDYIYTPAKSEYKAIRRK